MVGRVSCLFPVPGCPWGPPWGPPWIRQRLLLELLCKGIEWRCMSAWPLQIYTCSSLVSIHEEHQFKFSPSRTHACMNPSPARPMPGGARSVLAWGPPHRAGECRTPDRLLKGPWRGRPSVHGRSSTQASHHPGDAAGNDAGSGILSVDELDRIARHRCHMKVFVEVVEYWLVLMTACRSLLVSPRHGSGRRGGD